MAPCPKLKLAYAVGSLRLLKIKTPPQAVLRPRRRRNRWCAVDCARGGLGAVVTPVSFYSSLGKLAAPHSSATRQPERSLGGDLLYRTRCTPCQAQTALGLRGPSRGPGGGLRRTRNPGPAAPDPIGFLLPLRRAQISSTPVVVSRRGGLQAPGKITTTNPHPGSR